MKFTVTHLTGSRAGQTQELQAEVVTIGRDPGNTLAFDPVKDDAVSSFHANLVVQGGQVVVTDLGSRNGTFLNSHRIAGPTPVPPGAVLQFGDKGPTVVLSFGAAGPAPAAPPKGAAAPPPKGPAAPPPKAPGPTDTAVVPPPAKPATPPPAPAATVPPKAAGGGGCGGCRIFAVLGALLLTCVIGMVAVALREKIAKVVPSGLMTYVQKIPGLDKLFKVPPPPTLPPGIPVPKLPKGSTEKPATESEAPPPATDAPPPATDGKTDAPPPASEKK